MDEGMEYRTDTVFIRVWDPTKWKWPTLLLMLLRLKGEFGAKAKEKEHAGQILDPLQLLYVQQHNA